MIRTLRRTRRAASSAEPVAGRRESPRIGSIDRPIVFALTPSLEGLGPGELRRGDRVALLGPNGHRGDPILGVLRTDDVTGLRGKGFAFTDPLSTSGYLFATLLVKLAGIDVAAEAARTLAP